MPTEKNSSVKSKLHPRNRNRERYDLDALVLAVPDLAGYVRPNGYGSRSIDFSHPVAVRLLNRALLHHYYGVHYWDFPIDNLCPPIPGRADYLHLVADLLSACNARVIPRGAQVTCLDIGVGASCIYPIIGTVEYGWSFIASDIDHSSLAAAKRIVARNTVLGDRVDCRLQPDARSMFGGVLGSGERVDVSICNPPFHASARAAQEGARRKVANLSGQTGAPTLNFAGNTRELVYPGGEVGFITNMVADSAYYASDCLWFTSLVSKESSLKRIYHVLAKSGPVDVKTLPMGTGNKSSRIVAWTFLTTAQQEEWRASRW